MCRIFLHPCVVVLACVLHAGLAAFTHGTVVNNTHVSCELYCIYVCIAIYKG